VKNGAAIAPTSMPSSSVMLERLGYLLASPLGFRSRVIAARVESTVTIVGQSFMPRASVGYLLTPPKPRRTHQGGSTFLEHMTKTASNLRKDATSFSHPGRAVSP